MPVYALKVQKELPSTKEAEQMAKDLQTIVKNLSPDNLARLAKASCDKIKVSMALKFI